MPHTPPEASLLEGVALLEPVLKPHGFVFRPGPSGKGSGGLFASGTFARNDRTLELHFRHGLGLVSYRIGSTELSHEDYLRLSGNWPNRRYPGFGSSPMESFHALAHDLAAFCGDFLHGDGQQFKALAAELAANPSKYKGFGALGKR